jgi:P22 coat protein - gene protein 5
MPINSVPVRQEVTAEVLRVLMNNCLAIRWMGREHEQYFEERVPIGTTLQIKRPWRPKGRTGQAFNPEPIVQTTVPLTISYWRGGDFIYNDTDEALFLDMERFHEDYSRPLGIMIANQMDADALAYMQVTAPNFVGTPGTLPTGTSTYNSSQTSLNKLLAPQDMRSVIYTSDYNQNLVGAGQTLFNPQREIADQYLEGYVGKYAGFKFGIDEQIPGFTVGTYAGSPVVNGAGQSGTSLITSGWTSASLSLNPGDRFTVAGCYKVNPSGLRTAYSGSANLLQQVVTQAVTDSAGAATIQCYPGFIPAGQFQNCTAPANNAAITVAGASGASCNTAFYMQKEAYTAAFIKLHKPQDVQSEVMGGAESGTPGIYIRSIRQWQSSGPYAGYETERMDVIYGFAAQYADYMAGVIYG